MFTIQLHSLHVFFALRDNLGNMHHHCSNRIGEWNTKTGGTLSPRYFPALAVTVLMTRGCVLHCGCGYLHRGCLMENTETWVNGIWKTRSKDRSDTPVGERKVAVPILCRIRWEHLVTHMALLLSLADDIYISLDSTLLTWVAMCCHAWLLLPHTKHVQLHVFAVPLLHQFPRWLNLKSTQLFHLPLLCWWCWY